MSNGTGHTGEPATVVVETDRVSDWTVSPHILGKFTEMNAREGYPGIYSEYLANGSFEEWYTWPKRTPKGDPAWWRRTEVIYRDTEPYRGVAYPWEPVLDESSRATFEHPAGGVHGRVADGERIDVHGRPYREPEPRYQRISVWEGMAGIEQRLALPDRRTREYDISVGVRGRGLGGECEIRLTGGDGTVLASEMIRFGDSWERRKITLELIAESSERYRESPFGEVALAFLVEGRGHIDLDWAMLNAGDAVEGTFNPRTVETLREYEIPCIRWPGGNFVSQYRWQDAIGPPEERPVRSELHWGGLESNYLGINEFLEFCEHADVEPYVNVGFSHEIGPEEAAEMVEYVNGDPETTELGALRAEHGYDEPWNVEYWQVGNEVWGTFQIGHTDPADYAERFVAHHDAMTAIDPGITVFAVGLDPGDEGWGGRGWNETLFDVAGEAVDGIDIHRYVHGGGGDREWDPIEFNQQLVLYPTQFEDRLREAVEQAESAGIEDLLVTVGEWNLGARGLPDGPRATYGTMAHAAFCAGMYNAFLRTGKTTRFGHQRDNAFKFRPYPADLRPVHTANNAVLRLYTNVLADGRTWHLIPSKRNGPAGTIDWHGQGESEEQVIAPMEDVPLVDVAAVRADDGHLATFLVNRDLRADHTVVLDFGGVAPPTDVDAVVKAARNDPLDPTTEWDGEVSYETEKRTLRTDEDGQASIVLSPAAVARLIVDTEP